MNKLWVWQSSQQIGYKGEDMANGFDYESPLNRLLGVTIPQFLNQQLDRQESSRRFDEQMLAQIKRDNAAQSRFDKEFSFKEEQAKKLNAIENRKINLSEDQILFTSMKEADTISGRRKAFANEELGLKTDLFKNKVKIENNNLDKIEESNAKEIELYSKISPRLGQIASARANNIDMEMEDEVLKYLQLQGAANAQRGSAIIANYTTASKLYTDAPNQLSLNLITQEQFDERKSNFNASQDALNNYIKGDPALNALSPGESGKDKGSAVITGAGQGTISNPYTRENLPEKNNINSGDVVTINNKLFIADDEGNFEELPTETPATPEYIVSPSERQELEEGLAGMGEPLGFLEKAADDFAPILRYSPKQSYQAVKNFEIESDKAYGELVDKRETGRGGRRTFTKEEGSPDYEASATKLQDLIQNGYNLYLRIDPDTKGGKMLRKKLRKRIERYKKIAEAALKKGRSIEPGIPRGGYSVFSQSPDLIQLLDSIEF
jgi:hypothetical protein